MARPRKEINKSEFEGMCRIQCTEEEISEVLDCSVDTLERWCKREYGECFADVYKKKSAGGRMSLRRSQYEVAKSGNVTMLIWLGKQYLGQREPEQDIAFVEDLDDIRAEVYGDE